MSDSHAGAVGAPRPSSAKKHPSSQPERRGFFARIALFVRQVVAELKKVHTPTRAELLSYTVVVIVFVAAVMAFVTLLDFGIGKLVLWVFGN